MACIRLYSIDALETKWWGNMFIAFPYRVS